jgi:hypothetical protein
MGNVIQFRKPAPIDMIGRTCCECGEPATTSIALRNVDTGQDAGFKLYCDNHGHVTPSVPLDV